MSAAAAGVSHGSTACPDSRTLGRDGLGCAQAALGRDQELHGAGFAIYRKAHGALHGASNGAPHPGAPAGGATGRVETPASRRGLLAGVALAAGHRRRIFEGNRSAAVQFDEGACYVRSFSDPYRADVETGFDFFLLELAPAALDRTFAELDLPAAEGLACRPGEKDPVFAALAGALLPALERPDHAAPLFVEQVVCAMQTHLAARHHGRPPRCGHCLAPRRLAPRQVARAKEMLLAGMDGTVLIADIADACGVSRSHFIRGFREATGATPHHWLVVQRVARALALLAHSRLPLAEIAVSCGFADQSHMTRLVARLTGTTPGAWRGRH
ncbi:helix-turn-helix transcriptional regulator [Ancylobacter mangrovi]|uniref:helix-turn-helix transcriptional regulator n=1 Tax=Ancylobacter mangrovi TaxID=2972472 RepID=UPI002161C465|nr:AraC family transcriptional regulator [Ancylobacter mangrovi]MCS0502715.1 AraC family transcriptional regulator [Ancylobacter mangrovi]